MAMNVRHLSAWRVQWREAEVRLVGHEVGSLHLQDGFVSGQGRQVSIAHHLVVHSGLNAHACRSVGQHSCGRTLTTRVCASAGVCLTVMVEAGDPGVLRPLEDGRLTGVTCPSTCDSSRSK